MQVFLQIFAFLIANRVQIIEIIRGIEDLIPDAPGNEKAAAVRNTIAIALGLEGKIESAWPMVAPLFNLLVASVKAK